MRIKENEEDNERSQDNKVEAGFVMSIVDVDKQE
jgi:hypothetical protein